MEKSHDRCFPSRFSLQVEVLSRVHHRNITSLVGFCQDEDEQILLYEYLSNSDLQTHLHGEYTESKSADTIAWFMKITF